VEQNRRASFTFAAVVFSGLAIVAALSLIQPPPAPATIPSSPTPCAQAYPSQTSNHTTMANGTVITDTAYPALVMNPGSRVTLCVDYANGDYSGPAYNSVSSWNSTGKLSASQNVSTSASPPEVFLTQGETAAVEYVVTAGPQSRGFYGVGLLNFCIPVPLAVGYEPSQVNSTDFPGLFGARFCPAEVLDTQIVGYTGASIAYLTSASRFNPTINITGVSVSSVPTTGGAENVMFTMNLRSFSRPFTAGLSLNDSIVRVFEGNPDLTTLPVNDDCSWYPNNTNEVNHMNTTTFQNLPSGFMQIDAPVVQLGTYSNTTYAVSMLIAGPIATYTAVDPTLYVKTSGSPQTLYAIAAYFPVSVSGQLQTLSGQCEGSSSG
jgi:hypothetical protein